MKAAATVNLKQAAQVLGLKSEQHVRDLAKAGKIPGAHKVTLEDTSITVWRFTKEGLEEFKATPRQGGGSRETKQYIVLVPLGREQEFAEAMAALGMEQYRKPVAKTLTKKQRAAKQAAAAAAAAAETADDEDDAE